MRFTLFSVLALEAARFSYAVNLTDQAEYEQLAQTNAFLATEANEDNLAEALSKVISSLNPQQAQALAQLANTPAANDKPITTPGPKTKTMPAPPGGGKEKGTNIAITTATD